VEARTSMESTTQPVARRQRAAIDLEKLKSIRVPARGHNGAGGFRVDSPLSKGALPGVLVPANGHRDLASTAESDKDFVQSQLMEHGAVLFRGFDAGSVQAFDRFTKGICGELFMENGEHPRENISGTVYTPVFFSPERRLLWHNENTFNYRWPQKIWFCCVQPAEQGGETPIVDSRKVYEQMDPSVRERFMKHGQKVFRTEDRAQVERYCRENDIEYEWKGGDRLRTRSTRPAAVRHPATGEYCWINQAQHWHLSCLDDQTREALLAIFAEEDLPRTCCFGDGSPIPDAAMQSICQLYRELEVSFPWQRGDVLMVDNVFTAHARNPFSGERKLLVAMGELRSYADFSN
jgi:alpha-ketoglutarate-dependent taurine dioxygenase